MKWKCMYVSKVMKYKKGKSTIEIKQMIWISTLVGYNLKEEQTVYGN
jgi:hypothetical protein